MQPITSDFTKYPPRHLLSPSSWMQPACRWRRSRSRACTCATWDGCGALAPPPTRPSPSCTSTPPWAGRTEGRPTTSGCTGDGWGDPTPGSPPARWLCWAERTAVRTGWRSCRCLNHPACWSWWLNQSSERPPLCRRVTGGGGAWATLKTRLHRDLAGFSLNITHLFFKGSKLRKRDARFCIWQRKWNHDCSAST